MMMMMIPPSIRPSMDKIWIKGYKTFSKQYIGFEQFEKKKSRGQLIGNDFSLGEQKLNELSVGVAQLGEKTIKTTKFKV